MLFDQCSPCFHGVRTYLLMAMFFAAVALTVACGPSDHRLSEDRTMSTLVERTAVSQAKEDVTAVSVIDRFASQSFQSIDEAERVAGYHIPRPSAAYPMAFGQTALSNLPSYRRPLSTTQYTFPPSAPQSIEVDVGPSYDWDGDLTKGATKRLGRRVGWMLRNDNVTITFSFKCGRVDDVDVWCVVRAPAEIGLSAVDAFIATMA